MGAGTIECPVCGYEEADFIDVEMFGMCCTCTLNEIKRLGAIEEKLRKALALTDTDSPEFLARFPPSDGVMPHAFCIVKAIREVLL